MVNLKMEPRGRTAKRHMMRASLPSTAQNLTNARSILTDQLQKYEAAFKNPDALMDSKTIAAFATLVRTLADLEALTNAVQDDAVAAFEDMSPEEQAAAEAEARKLLGP